MLRPAFLLALVLAAAGCAGQAAPRAPQSFADLERCTAALEQIAATPVEKRAQADLTACGGGRIDTGRQALVRAAEWLARRRADAKSAERKDLLAEIDRVASAVLPVALSARGEDYELPVSRAKGPPVAALCSYTAVRVDSLRRESCGMAQLQPHRTPPLARLEGARSKVIAYPILLVADAGMPAARLLAVAEEHEDGAVVVAVQGEGAVVFQHPVELRGEVDGEVALVALRPDADRPAIERMLDAVRGKAEALALGLGPDVTAQLLVDALDAAAAAGFKVVTSPRPRGAGAGHGVFGGMRPGPMVRAGSASGTIPYEPVIAMRYVRRHLGAVQACFERPAAAKKGKAPPPIIGRFATELVIDATGKVTAASIAGLADRQVKSCALAVLQRIEFLEGKGAGVLRFPLIVEKGL